MRWRVKEKGARTALQSLINEEQYTYAWVDLFIEEATGWSRFNMMMDKAQFVFGFLTGRCYKHILTPSPFSHHTALTLPWIWRKKRAWLNFRSLTAAFRASMRSVRVCVSEQALQSLSRLCYSVENPEQVLWGFMGLWIVVHRSLTRPSISSVHLVIVWTILTSWSQKPGTSES